MKKRMLTLLLTLVALLGLLPVAALADDAEPAPITTFEALQTAINSGGTIVLGGDIAISDNLTVSTAVTIQGSGLYKLTRGEGYTGGYFTVSGEGASLTLDNVIVDGGNTWSYKVENITYGSYTESELLNVPDNKLTNANLILVDGASLTLQNKTVIQNVYVAYGWNDKIPPIISGKNKAVLNFKDASIQHCAGEMIHADDSTVTMDGLSYIGNLTTANKGGFVNLQNSATLTIKGNTKINGNIAHVRSGVIGICGNSSATIENVEISGNLVLNGGSNACGVIICLERAGDLTMTGGKITNNTGMLAGAIASRWTDGFDNCGPTEITLTGGEISGNSTGSSSWKNATIFLRNAKTTIGENMIIQGDVVLDDNASNFVNKSTITGSVTLNKAAAAGSYDTIGTITGDIHISDKIQVTIEETDDGNKTVTGPAIIDKDKSKISITGDSTNGSAQLNGVEVPNGVQITIPSSELGNVNQDNEGNITVPDGSTITVGGKEYAVTGDNVTVDGEGNITVGENSSITIDGQTVTGPASVDSDGNVTVDAGGKTNGVEIPDGATVTIPGADLLTQTQEDSISVGSGGTITTADGTTVTGPASIDSEGNVTVGAGGKIATPGEDGSTDTTVTIPEGTSITVPVDSLGDVTSGEDGIQVPSGASATVGGTGSSTTVSGDIKIEADGTVTIPEDGSATVGGTAVTGPAAVMTGEGGKVVVKLEGNAVIGEGVEIPVPIVVPAEKLSEVEQGANGSIIVPEGTIIPNADKNTTTVNSGTVTVNKDGSITVPEKSEVTVITKKDGEAHSATITGPAEVSATGDVTLKPGSSITINGETAKVPAGVEIEIDAEDMSGVKVDNKGNITVDQGTTITVNGTTITGPVSIDSDGNVTISAGGSINGVTITNGATVTVPADKLDQITKKDGDIWFPAGSTITTSDGKTYTAGTGVTLHADGNVTVHHPIFIPTTPSTPETPAETVVVNGNKATVTLGSTEPTVITIPYADAEGKVVRDAATGEIVPFCVVTENGIQVLVNGSCELEIVTNERGFTDVDSHWAKTFIDFVTERELYDGMTNTTFGPDAKMTQAMLIVVLAGMDGNEASGNDWYTWAVNWGIENDIFTVTDTTTEMSREDFALMLFNYAKKLGLDTTISADLSVFPDADEISASNLTAMQWAVAAGLMEGRTDGTIDPTASATRAEVAVMLMNFIIFAVQ